jgi:hypothetical protein
MGVPQGVPQGGGVGPVYGGGGLGGQQAGGAPQVRFNMEGRHMQTHMQSQMQGRQPGQSGRAPDMNEVAGIQNASDMKTAVKTMDEIIKATAAGNYSQENYAQDNGSGNYQNNTSSSGLKTSSISRASRNNVPANNANDDLVVDNIDTIDVDDHHSTQRTNLNPNNLSNGIGRMEGTHTSPKYRRAPSTWNIRSRGNASSFAARSASGMSTTVYPNSRSTISGRSTKQPASFDDIMNSPVKEAGSPVKSGSGSPWKRMGSPFKTIGSPFKRNTNNSNTHRHADDSDVLLPGQTETMTVGGQRGQEQMLTRNQLFLSEMEWFR